MVHTDSEHRPRPPGGERSRFISRSYAGWYATGRSRRQRPHYVLGFDRGEAMMAQVGTPEIGGRLFYNADMSGLNFRPECVPLGVVLETLLRDLNAAQPPAIYIGSTTLDT